MAKRKYGVEYDPAAVEELQALRRFSQVRVISAVEKHLLDTPTLPKGSTIKKLDPPVLAAFRLRVGDLRVFYDVEEANQTVRIIAIRAKGQRTLGEIAHDSGD